MIETTGIVNEKIFQELKGSLIAPKQRIFFWVAVGVCTAMAVLCAAMRDLTKAVTFLILGAILLAEKLILQKKGIKRNLDRIEETTGRREIPYTVRLEEDGITVHNHATDASVQMAYESFIKIKETESIYALFTKSWQYVPVFKNGLSEEQREELLRFLQSKPTQIKWKQKNK